MAHVLQSDKNLFGSDFYFWLINCWKEETIDFVGAYLSALEMNPFFVLRAIIVEC